MNINYSDRPTTGYRIRLVNRRTKTSETYPMAGQPYYASFADALGVLNACLERNPAKFSYTTFEIVYEWHAMQRPIPADGLIPDEPNPAQ